MIATSFSMREVTRCNPFSATVFIVDDDPDIRKTTAKLIMSIGFDTDSYASGREFLSGYDQRKVGCVILDYQMPGLSGLEVQRTLKTLEIPPPIVFVTGQGDVSFATSAMRDGAVNVLVKPVAADVLLAQVQEAVEIDVLQRSEHAVASEIRERLCRLTPREQEIATLLAAGESCKQIARRLEICHKTVDNHQTILLQKLEVDNPTQLARLLVRLEAK